MFQQDAATDLQKRLPLLAVYIVLFAVALLIRLWYLQAIKGDYYYEQAESNRIRPVKLRPPRGIIYDREGRPDSAGVELRRAVELAPGIKQYKDTLKEFEERQ